MDIENHPIPQDITGFQFKLIGSMTIKQFAYLAGGFIIAWVWYISPLYFVIKITFAIASAALGTALAFLPINGRPLDITIVNFFRAVFKPTRYVYQKTDIGLIEKDATNIHSFNKKRQTIAEMSEDQLQAFLKNLPQSKNNLDKKEMVFFKNIGQIQQDIKTQPLPEFVPQHAFTNTAPVESMQNLPPPAIDKTGEVQPTALILPEAKIQSNAPPLQTISQKAGSDLIVDKSVDSKEYLETHEKVMGLQKNLNDMLIQQQQLEDKLIRLQKQMVTPKQEVFSPTIATEELKQTNLVRSIPQGVTKNVGLIPTPEFPNLISGIIKDPRGNPLSNILVEVKDAQGNAVRAFKTNALGQFTSATSLMNGDYTIEFEDPKGQNNFVSVGFKASGEIILPIEITSVDTREELRRSLFN